MVLVLSRKAAESHSEWREHDSLVTRCHKKNTGSKNQETEVPCRPFLSLKHTIFADQADLLVNLGRRKQFFH